MRRRRIRLVRRAVERIIRHRQEQAIQWFLQTFRVLSVLLGLLSLWQAACSRLSALLRWLLN